MSQALVTSHVNLLFIFFCCDNWWSLVWMQTIVLYSLVLINIVYPTVVMVTRDHHIPSTMPWWKWLKKCCELELYSYKTERGSTDIKERLRNYDNINIQYKHLVSKNYYCYYYLLICIAQISIFRIIFICALHKSYLKVLYKKVNLH